MAFQYDINKIFEELEQKARNMQKQKEEKNIEDVENNPIESPEDAPKTQEVAPATSKTSEDTHGGDEASKEIKDSPNSVEGGKNDKKKNKSEKTQNTGTKFSGSEVDNKTIHFKEKEENEHFGTGVTTNHQKWKPKTTPE